MDEHEVALVAEQRDRHRRARLAPSHGGERLRRLGGQPAAQVLRPDAPLRPPDAEHLVEDAPALERLGNTRVVHGEGASWPSPPLYEAARAGGENVAFGRFTEALPGVACMDFLSNFDRE